MTAVYCSAVTTDLFCTLRTYERQNSEPCELFADTLTYSYPITANLEITQKPAFYSLPLPALSDPYFRLSVSSALWRRGNNVA